MASYPWYPAFPGKVDVSEPPSCYAAAVAAAATSQWSTLGPGTSLDQSSQPDRHLAQAEVATSELDGFGPFISFNDWFEAK